MSLHGLPQIFTKPVSADEDALDVEQGPPPSAVSLSDPAGEDFVFDLPEIPEREFTFDQARILKGIRASAKAMPSFSLQRWLRCRVSTLRIPPHLLVDFGFVRIRRLAVEWISTLTV